MVAPLLLLDTRGLLARLLTTDLQELLEPRDLRWFLCLSDSQLDWEPEQ